MKKITIKQPSIYIDFTSPNWVDPYDRVLVRCECGELMERGMGLCDKCIDRESYEIESDLRKLVNVK